MNTERLIKWYLRFTALVVAVLVVMVVFLGLQNRATIAAQSRDNIQQCQASNATRLQDIAIWNRLLKIGPDATASQKAEVAELNHLVTVKDTPRNCVAVFNTSGDSEVKK